MTTSIQDKIIDLFPTKDQFWRRFFPIWFLFNWKYFYVLFESPETLYPYTRLEYVSYLREQNLMVLRWFQNGVPDGWMVLLNICFSLIFPFFLVPLYYWLIHPKLIQPVYFLFTKAEVKKKEALSDIVEREFKDNQLKELWETQYQKEIVEQDRQSSFLEIFIAISWFLNNEDRKIVTKKEVIQNINNYGSRNSKEEIIEYFRVNNYLNVKDNSYISMTDKFLYLAQFNVKK